MATITTRSGKGSALTHTEMDNNLTNLNTDKIEADSTDTLTNKTINTASNTITIVEADISDLQSYLTAETNDLTASVTWANVPDANITQSSVTQHQAALSITESQISDLSHYANSDVDAHLNQSTATTGEVLSWNGADYDWVAQSGGLADIVDDTNPQLGGDLDVNGNSIVSVTNGDIAITPNGTGDTLVTNLTLANSLDVNDQEITTGVGTEVKVGGNLRLRGTRYVFFEEGTGGTGIKLQAPTGVTGTPTFTLPAADGTNGQILKTDGSGNLSFTDDAGGIALTDLSVTAEGTPSGDGSISYNNTTGEFTYTPPVDITGNSATATALQTARNIAGVSFDGTANIAIGINNLSDVDTTGVANDKILKYNSTSGNWEIADDSTGAGGLASLVDDTTPQLGGDLDVNGKRIISANTNQDIVLDPSGTGDVVLGTMRFDVDQTIGAGQDNYVLTYDDATGKISLEASAGGGLTDIVDDATPQLGGTLDMNANRIQHDTGSARGVNYAIGSSGTLPQTSHMVGPSLFKRNDAFNANSRVYLYNGIQYIKMDNENTTVTGSNGRFRGNFDALSLDVNGCSYGTFAPHRGLIGKTNQFYLSNDNDTYSPTLPRVVGTDGMLAFSIGRTIDYGNSAGDNADMNIQSAYVFSGTLLDETRTAQTGRTHFTSDTAVYQTMGASADGNNNLVWDSGAKAYNVKNDQPNYLEKFGAVEQYSEYAYQASHSSGASFTVDYNNGNVQLIELTSNVTSFTMSNFPGTNNITGNQHIGTVTLFLQQDGTGGRTISFTAGAGETFKIANGVTTADTGAGNFTVAHVMKVGSTYLWTISGNYT